MRGLAVVQAWFQAVITHPDSVVAGVEEAAAILDLPLERVVTRGPALGALERMDIYHHAYHARLTECLADDYPVLAQAVGEARFAELARRYIAVHPSREPNLNAFGRHLPGFCLLQADLLGEAGFAAELARLEWAMVEVVHARAEAPLTLEALQAVAPEAWPELELVPSGALRLLVQSYPVNRYLQAVKQGESPELPAPAPAATVVYRQDYTVWRMELSPPMAALLGALTSGRRLGEALELLDASVDQAEVMTWFREWITGGLFSRIAP